MCLRCTANCPEGKNLVTWGLKRGLMLDGETLATEAYDLFLDASTISYREYFAKEASRCRYLPGVLQTAMPSFGPEFVTLHRKTRLFPVKTRPGKFEGGSLTRIMERKLACLRTLNSKIWEEEQLKKGVGKRVENPSNRGVPLLSGCIASDIYNGLAGRYHGARRKVPGSTYFCVYKFTQGDRKTMYIHGIMGQMCFDYEFNAL
ncbi:hypothetical protein SELMODRAFT_429534 [Selaginella moellendorffii]|uniref:Uncharacterized protein n=1 Tax=Selaginella moellendorffii TaxID=88036 RepID=D8T6H6_SELML|nr:hypothetical protein SELMODRAFT_429534 [Selaginella moellendorffii]